MSYIKRDMETIVATLSEQYPAILITGPRQVGKTTMLQTLMEGTDRTYVSLDDLNIRALAKSDPEMFFQIYKTPIVIDEVQYAPELFTYILRRIAKKQQPGEFWLAGTPIVKLMKGVQEALAGRVAVLNLTSLSQNELHNSCGNVPFTPDLKVLSERQKVIKVASTPDIFRRIYVGGMPGLISDKYKDNNSFYMSYLSTYLERDVKELAGTLDFLNFMRFITAVACRSSQIVNYAEIARDADINQITAKSWMAILETLGIIFYLHPYSNNILKRTIKTPKFYFHDTGLCTYLTKWSSPETLESGAMNSAVLENFVVSEIVKSYNNSAKTPNLYYYRDKDMKEIDLIIEVDGKLCPIEIKKTASPTSQLTNVFKTLDKAAMERGNGAVLCMKGELMAFDRKNYIIPIWLI
jgi:predicted AAA+ superfamily ATPase